MITEEQLRQIVKNNGDPDAVQIKNLEQMDSIENLLKSGKLVENKAVSYALTKDSPLAQNTPSNEFLYLWESMGGPTLKKEYRFHDTRRWKFDFALPDLMIAIEIEGGAWTRGRHTRGKGFIEDCHKYNTAQLMGWTVFRLATGMTRAEFIQPIIDFVKERM